ncbi:Interferon-activable protein 203 [Tupaia chinensis]|uniref:Interferon-activable protein 203 n=1 Tax=Tupaia chinensis TaxID=246437 RepID=L8Y2J5_TUPCH|nr:Interferon-activable protein 203 [Tupaia chinensis]
MVSEYKKIVLLKGLEVLSDYQFRTIKSLLARDLKLSRKMQEEYNRIQIADLLEEKFRGDAGVDQLIELFKDMETLKHLAKSLQKAKSNGTSIDTTESCPPPSPMPTPILSSGSAMKKPRLKNVPKEASEEVGYQSGPKEVMVLKVTEPLTYEFNGEKRTMFHATVATESEFFHVKVFNISLKEKFIPKKIISLSDYVGRNGFLEIYNLSSVSDVNPDQKMEISRRLIRNANATPKINHLYSQTEEKFVNGVFMVHKKNVRDQCTYYEIQDSTGRMEVVVYGRLTKTHCEEGDKIKLTCFELAFSVDRMQLRSVIHSDMKVSTPWEPHSPEVATCLVYTLRKLDCCHYIGSSADEKKK